MLPSILAKQLQKGIGDDIETTLRTLPSKQTKKPPIWGNR